MEVEANERAAKEEEEAALHEIIQSEVEYLESKERDLIEEYTRKKAEDETEAEAIMR